MPKHQLTLSFSAIRNSELFSNHWLETRLPLELEWQELRQEAKDVLDAILKLWKVQKPRVEQYGAEQPLEQAFVQPVFERTETGQTGQLKYSRRRAFFWYRNAPPLSWVTMEVNRHRFLRLPPLPPQPRQRELLVSS